MVFGRLAGRKKEVEDDEDSNSHANSNKLKVTASCDDDGEDVTKLATDAPWNATATATRAKRKKFMTESG